jgi:transposase
MRTERFVLSDSQWKIIAPLLPGKASDCGVTAKDNRLFVEAVLWRDLPSAFGAWNSIFRRFRRWAKAGVFDRIFKALSGEPDFEYALIDGTIVSVHQKASGAKGGLSIRPLAGRKAA